MKKIDAISRSITLLVTLSVVYALLDTSIIMLAPILTVVIPYNFMKYKEEENLKKNRSILSRLLIFNLVTFLIVSIITNKISIEIFEIISNIILVTIYYQILLRAEKKKEELENNPQKLYEVMTEKIQALEVMYKKIEDNIENAKNERAKNSMEMKKDALEFKIDELKEQANLVKRKIEANENTQGL